MLDFTSRAMETISANSTLSLGIIAAAVIAIVLGVLWARGRAEKGATADLRASALVGAYTAGQFDTALEMANAMLSSYSGTRGAAIAAYVKGKTELQLGKLAEAEQSFSSYLEVSAKAPFYEVSARQGLAASLEGAGRFAEAAEIYQKLSQELQGAPADEAALDAARAFRLAGATDRARGLLESLKGKDNAFARRARIELAALEYTDAAGPPAWQAAPADTLRPAATSGTP